MAIVIRMAGPGDTNVLAELFLECRRDAFHWLDAEIFQLSDFQKQTEGERVFVAEEGGELVGFISVWEKDAFIHHLFVSPRFQRRGIGTMLVKSLYSWLPLPYTLKCDAKNEQALAFYQTTGWQETGKGCGEHGEYILLAHSRNRL